MWTPIANMRVGRTFPGVGVLYGELYVVGGCTSSNLLRSVEKYTPSTGVWTKIADMHMRRKNPGNFLKNNCKLFNETFFFF